LIRTLGCFKDNWTRDLRLFLARSKTFDECVDLAKEKKQYYVGFQNGNECWGDTNIGAFEKVDDSECNMPCVDNKDKRCGGSWRNTVYDIRHLEEDKQN